MSTIEAVLVRPGDVARTMGTTRRRIEDVSARRPERLRLARPVARRVIESIEGYVEHLGERAEVLLYEEGQSVAYEMPVHDFRVRGIGEGDRFWVDVIDAGGRIVGAIRADEPPAGTERPEDYMTPGELQAIADPWE